MKRPCRPGIPAVVAALVALSAITDFTSASDELQRHAASHPIVRPGSASSAQSAPPRKTRLLSAPDPSEAPRKGIVLPTARFVLTDDKAGIFAGFLENFGLQDCVDPVLFVETAEDEIAIELGDRLRAGSQIRVRSSAVETVRLTWGQANVQARCSRLEASAKKRSVAPAAGSTTSAVPSAAQAPAKVKSILTTRDLSVSGSHGSTKVRGTVVNTSFDICHGPTGHILLIDGGHEVGSLRIDLPSKLGPLEHVEFSGAISGGSATSRVVAELGCRDVESRNKGVSSPGAEVLRRHAESDRR